MKGKDITSFAAYLQAFFDQKSDQISMSNQTIPNRFSRITIDLSQNPATLPGSDGTWVEYSRPIRALHIERVYSTAVPATNKTGFIKFIADYNNIGNIANYKLLQPNDSFELDQMIAKFYLTWTIQADTSVDVVGFIDIDFRAGAAATAIVGNVSVISSSSGGVAVREVPTGTVQKSGDGSTYTVPAGKYADISVFLFALGTAGQVTAKINTILVANIQSVSAEGNSMEFNTRLVAGDVLLLNVLGGIGTVGANIVEYANS